MKIGVFDSGIGGKSVANAIEKEFPEDEVFFRNDADHVPYGLKTPVEILELITPILEKLIDEGCQVIVIACNTVSTTLMPALKERFTIPFVALVPMVKPAAGLTTSKVIAVCATPATLQSPRYAELKEQYATGLTVLEPDCSDWAYLIEQNRLDEAKLESRINEVLDKGADVIVLGCTHYHWIENEIKELAEGRAVVLQPEEAIIRQLTRVLAPLR
jgi:glutamate racemase